MLLFESEFFDLSNYKQFETNSGFECYFEVKLKLK